MELAELARNARIRRIITHPDDDSAVWRGDLKRLLAGDATLDRGSVGEPAVVAVQRLMVFLGYSTSSNGAFAIDGDFGRGTNRGVAQFQVEHGLTRRIGRDTLCYPCSWRNARSRITAIPDARLTPATLRRMAQAALQRIDAGDIMGGGFDAAVFHLNALHRRHFLNSRQVLERYGDAAHAASRDLQDERGIRVLPQWVLSIIRQETAGVMRPRFEQHYLSRLNARHPEIGLAELRMRSMSMGLGQIMGSNFRKVGAPDATTLFTAPADEQVAFIARFLATKRHIVHKVNPGEADFRIVARYYNGPGYEAHFYHEKLARWFAEFRHLM